MTKFRVLIAGLAATAVAAGVPLIALAAATPRTPQQIWDQVCSNCHVTGPGPVILGAHFPADRIKAVVRNGGLEMTPFSADDISDDELDALAKWVSAHDAVAK